MKKEVISIRKTIHDYENLLPPFKEWDMHSNAIITNPYEFILTPDVGFETSNSKAIKVEVDTDYVLNIDKLLVGSYAEIRESATLDGSYVAVQNASFYETEGFVFRPTKPFIKVRLANGSYADGVTSYTFRNVILTKGSSFRKFIPMEDNKISERIKDNGVIEQLNVRFYKGVEKSLQVRPYVLHDGRRIHDLLTYPDGTDNHISGDNDSLIFPVWIEVNYDDEIIVEYENVGDFPYTLAVDIVISYNMHEIGGSERAR